MLPNNYKVFSGCLAEETDMGNLIPKAALGGWRREFPLNRRQIEKDFHGSFSG